ncbi:acyltransferase family protein [Salinivibrio socompensis]|uniref:acyltransferase family protein n=1 Tax=Salinivibrio socompensis TaxID=1510206 RepID=UPI000FE13ED6|nr:acyltransferase family protein [Salinivibrio socompensis]
MGPRATRRGNDRIPCTWYQYPISALHHGGWLSYTTINTVLISAAVFLAVRQWRQGRTTPSWVATLSRYSLGIYLIHPIFLWPVRAYWPTLSPSWVWIPVLTIYAFAGAALITALLQRQRITAWLVP